jgi:isopentenyl diphosphate isomerase/L-lactate dehydrogenase-like FMN-dependent dehydrogenase
LRRARAPPRRAAWLVELLEADGLAIDLNPIQEQVQPEGRRSRDCEHGGGHRHDRACQAPVPVVVDGDRLRHA